MPFDDVANKLKEKANKLRDKANELRDKAKKLRAANHIQPNKELVEQARQCEASANKSETIVDKIDPIINDIRTNKQTVINNLTNLHTYMDDFDIEICEQLTKLIQTYYLEDVEPYSSYWTKCGGDTNPQSKP